MIASRVLAEIIEFCHTALVNLTDRWMTRIDKVDFIVSMFIDYRKAFPLVDHEILLIKLSSY